MNVFLPGSWLLTDSYLTTPGEPVLVEIQTDKIYHRDDICPACRGLGPVVACVAVGVLAASMFDELTPLEQALVTSFCRGSPLPDIDAMLVRAGLPRRD